MVDYIDRNRLIKKFCNHCYFDVGEKNCVEDCYDMKIIKSLPTEDVQPVKRGRWVFNKPPDDWIMSLYTCDQCGHVEDGKPNYCPNCGAKMDGET